MRVSRIWWLVGSVFLAALLGFGGYRYYLVEYKVEPAPLITETLAKAHQARSYRYQIDADYDSGTRKQSWTHILGERSDTSYHFKGTLAETPTEIYQIDNRSYTLDPVNKKWYVLEGVDLARTQLYNMEIDPLSSFRYKEIVNPRVMGTERINGRKCWVVEFQPVIDSRYLEMWWKNFTYRLWVEKKGHNLLKGVVSAENKNSSGTFLTMTVSFQDYNEKITINPPQ